MPLLVADKRGAAETKIIADLLPNDVPSVHSIRYYDACQNTFCFSKNPRGFLIGGLIGVFSLGSVGAIATGYGLGSA
jgi:hypothetical protein